MADLINRTLVDVPPSWLALVSVRDRRLTVSTYYVFHRVPGNTIQLYAAVHRYELIFIVLVGI